MMHKYGVVLLVLLCAVWAHATLTVHIQSPWRNNSTAYDLYLLGGATGYGTSPDYQMTDEGDGWYSYTWDKVVTDFSWQDFSVRGCPSGSCATSDAWSEGGTEVKFSMTTLFASESELWIYTDANSHTISLTPPGSKVVWFKSPWGNKALPQIVFGADTALMYFAQDDKSTCGWFAGAISPAMMKSNPAQSAYFVRYNASYLSFPAKDAIDLSGYLSLADTIFVDGTGDVPTIDTEIGTLGECFDSTRTLHVYHPWRTNSTIRDSAIYLDADNVGQSIKMDSTGEYTYWWVYTFPVEKVNDQQWKGATLDIKSDQNGSKRFFKIPAGTWRSPNRPNLSSIFPKGVYEAWFYTKDKENYVVLYAPLEPKVIRLLSPWDNMSPMMITSEDTLKMGPISKDTCGWYQALSFKHVDAWDVRFREAFGYEHYTAAGLSDGDPIVLDSMMALHDTVWVYPYPTSNSAPRFSESYPNRLGICPTMKISALVVDWAGEGVMVAGEPDYSQNWDKAQDVDFGGIYDGNDYTIVMHPDSTGEIQEYKSCQGLVTGMVEDTLVNGLPARVDSLKYPWNKCSAAREIEKWFVPVEVAQDKNGNTYTNGVCRDIDLTLDAEGFWLADISEAHEDGGFFPIDDLEYLDSAKTVKNPKFDWSNQLTAGGKKHNYSFSMKISAQFQYVKGQYFEFRGDDDVWVFINNRLVVDIGGCHGPMEGFVDLDTIGQNDPKLKLVEGQEYPFHIFFSERNATGSNFKMRTSINLRTQKTYYTEEVPSGDGIISYNLMQLLVDESLSCDVSSVSKVEKKAAQSVFMLVGGNLPKDGQPLDPGVNYGGINISENMAGFSIDTSAIVRSRSLPSGNYVLICYLASDQSQYQMIPFVVPEYPKPDIAFVDVFEPSDSLKVLDPTGLNLRGQRLGEDPKNDTLLAHVTYPEGIPLKVAVLYVGTVCNDCIVPLNFMTKDSLTFLDEHGQIVTSVTTDSTGYASFYVVGESAMVNGSFKIGSDYVSNEISWTNIHFKEPPVPFVSHAKMFDVDGNGIPDSLVIPFSKSFGENIPDTLSWSFGESTFHDFFGKDAISPLVTGDSILIVRDGKDLLKSVFTGATDEIYTGSIKYHYTYQDEDSGDTVKLGMSASIEDHVGPVILSAIIEPKNDDFSILTVNLSEGTSTKITEGASTFAVYRDSLNISDSLIFNSVENSSKGNVFRIIFRRTANGTLPVVGDSIKLVPGILKDLSGNDPHFNNPKIRITGKQRTKVTVPGIIKIGDDGEKWEYKKDIAPILVPTNKTVKDIVEEIGKPGALLNFNIGELATETMMNLSSSADKDSALATIRIDYENYYFTHLGGYVNHVKGTIRCNDATVFYNENDPDKSNCYDNPGNIFFEWNGLSDKKRLVGTGVYVTKVKVKIRSGKSVAGESNDTYSIGIKRSK
ncbi:MAG: fibro-slime domain-containing protein [Fibrobacter sp.]|nr:fibro-slime domain-containing protein [Fibrobacter sp.]